jgi:Tfp pilus assembly protein FimV
MSIFNTILEKLGIQKPAATAATATPAKPAATSTSAPTSTSAAPVFTPTAAYTPPAPAAAPASHPAAVAVVDVMSKLDKLAGSNSGLDWKVSIVDLLKLLGMDSSLEARKTLAGELNCPADLMNDSAKMNTWLHQTVLQKIAENGGNIPQSLLHK